MFRHSCKYKGHREMLKLYQFGNSVCAQKVLMTLDEKGLDFETQDINLFKNEQYNPEYLKLNPKGVVPTLDHDGNIIIESTLICEYLDDTFPNPSLVPEDPFLRSQMRLWSKAVDEGIFEATREITFASVFREKMKDMSPDQREKRYQNVGDPERRARYISTYENGVKSPYVRDGIAKFEKLFKNMETTLADGRKWLLGDGYTLADISITPFIARLYYLALLEIWLEERPCATAWWERAKSRPSYEVAIGHALTEIQKIEMETYGVKARETIRLRRDQYLGSY